MKETLWTIVEVVVAIVTILMATVVLALFGMNLATLPYLAFMVLVLYQIVPRKWGVFGTCSAIIVACIYLANMFLFAMFWQPAFCLMSSLMPITAVILMLRRKPLWVWGVVALIFLTIGVYYVFNNNIVGPMDFRIRDRPIDTPAQWYHCYRFYWCGVVAETVSQFAGFVSIIVIAVYILYRKFTSQGL